jgi:hypothetical protein
LPEERQRYWNAYMLFYESRVEKKATKTPRQRILFYSFGAKAIIFHSIIFTGNLY